MEVKGGIYSGGNCLTSSKEFYTSFECKGKNMQPKSITIGLAEDALVQHISLYFFESFSARVKSFKVELSLDGEDLNWIDGGRHVTKQYDIKQTFTLPKSPVARIIRIKFEDSYESPHHYCTISQIVVTGKTYSSYAAQ
jgi:Sad1 / UNC-like C-terminal